MTCRKRALQAGPRQGLRLVIFWFGHLFRGNMIVKVQKIAHGQDAPVSWPRKVPFPLPSRVLDHGIGVQIRDRPYFGERGHRLNLRHLKRYGLAFFPERKGWQLIRDGQPVRLRVTE